MAISSLSSLITSVKPPTSFREAVVGPSGGVTLSSTPESVGVSRLRFTSKSSPPELLGRETPPERGIPPARGMLLKGRELNCTSVLISPFSSFSSKVLASSTNCSKPLNSSTIKFLLSQVKDGDWVIDGVKKSDFKD